MLLVHLAPRNVLQTPAKALFNSKFGTQWNGFKEIETLERSGFCGRIQGMISIDPVLIWMSRHRFASFIVV